MDALLLGLLAALLWGFHDYTVRVIGGRVDPLVLLLGVLVTGAVGLAPLSIGGDWAALDGRAWALAVLAGAGSAGAVVRGSAGDLSRALAKRLQDGGRRREGRRVSAVAAPAPARKTVGRFELKRLLGTLGAGFLALAAGGIARARRPASNAALLVASPDLKGSIFAASVVMVMRVPGEAFHVLPTTGFSRSWSGA